MSKYLVNPETPAYRKAAEIEGEFWGQVVWNPESPSSAQAPIARYENRLIGNMQSDKLWAWLDAIIPELGVIENALSLGAGIGAFEIEMFGRGVIKNIELVDISEGACITAKKYLMEKFGKEAESRISVKVQDLNFAQLPENKYDLIIAMGIIHHLINLEHIFDQIHNSLRSGGKILMHEMIGDFYYQFNDNALTLIDEWQKSNTGLPYTVEPKKIPWGGGYCSPFECVRSGDLFNIIKEYFPGNPIKEVKYGGIYFPYLLLSQGKWRKLQPEIKDEFLTKLVDYEDKMHKAQRVNPMRLFAIYPKTTINVTDKKITPWTSNQLWENINEMSQMSLTSRLKYSIKRNPLVKKILSK